MIELLQTYPFSKEFTNSSNLFLVGYFFYKNAWYEYMTCNAPHVLHSTVSWTLLGKNYSTLSSYFDFLSNLSSYVSTFASGINCFNLSNDMLWVLMYCLDSAGARKCSQYFGFVTGRSIQKSISWRILYPLTSTFWVRTFCLILSQRVHPSFPHILN